MTKETSESMRREMPTGLFTDSAQLMLVFDGERHWLEIDCEVGGASRLEISPDTAYALERDVTQGATR
jgi:hypothetical protein